MQEEDTQMATVKLESDGDSSSSSADVQMLLVPRVKPAAKLDLTFAKAARKSAPHGSHPPQHTASTPKQKLKPQAAPRVSKTGRPSVSLVKARVVKASEFRIDELPLPFAITVQLRDLQQVSLPFPCFVEHHFSLAIRHDCQSPDQASALGFPATVSEWLDSDRDLATTIARSTFVSLEYPPLPISSTIGPIPQRSELLLRYSISSALNSTIFQVTVPLSVGRRVTRTGIAKSKKSPNGGVATFSWKIAGDAGEIDDERIAGPDQLKTNLENRLKRFEEEWREEVVERERVEHQLAASDTNNSPIPLPPTGFAKTASLIPGLDKGVVSGSTVNDLDLPPFLPIPRYEFVRYSTRAVPVTGRSLEVFPYVRGWEDTNSANQSVEEQVSETMTYSPGPYDTEEKVKEEQEWMKLNLVSRKALEGLDPGHVLRDFAALEGLFDDLSLDREEFARRFKENSGQDNSCETSEWSNIARRENSVAAMCRHFEKRLGTPLEAVQQNARSISEREAIRVENLIDDCEYCGGTCCMIHPSLFAYNTPSSFGTSSHLNRPLPRPLKSVGAGAIDSEWVTQESDGYSPCDCGKVCRAGCRCRLSKSYCDRFCGCPPTCQNRFQGCECHQVARSLGSIHRCCVAKHEKNDCRCRRMARACDPRICGTSDHCNNMQIQRARAKATIPVLSDIPNGGYGLVALEKCQPGDSLGCYAGEKFNTEANSWDDNGYGSWKDAWAEYARISFWFDLDQEHSVDSQEYGNLTRFINHRANKLDNVGATVTYVDGAPQIAIAATEKLKAGQELFLNYGENYNVASSE